MGAKYDEEAGRRAKAEGRDLASLESQVQTMVYRPERDRARNNPYRTMDYRPERDGYGGGMVKLNASEDSAEGGGGQVQTGESAGALGQDLGLGDRRSPAEIQGILEKANGMLNDLSAPQSSTENTYGGSGDGDGADKLMDYFPDPSGNPEYPDSEGLGDVGNKMLDVANRPGTPEDKALGRLEDGVKNVGGRVDWQVVMNEMQDKLDEKKVVWVGGKAYPWNEVYKGVDEVPNGNNVWEYNNKTGILSKNGEIVYNKGYSGKGPGLNNPEMVGVRDIGPTPNGIYEINSRETREKFGDSWALDETNPEFIEKIKRDPGTFYIHGDNKYGNRSASEGCIVIPRDIRNMMNDGDVLKVITK